MTRGKTSILKGSRIFFALLVLLLLHSCDNLPQKQTEWIYENLPDYVRYDIQWASLQNEFNRLGSSLADMGNDAISNYERQKRNEDADNEFLAAVIGWSDMYELVEEADKVTRTNVINNYVDRTEDIIGKLKECAVDCFSDGTAASADYCYYSDEDVFYTLIGTPGNTPDAGYDQLLNIAIGITKSAISKIERPSISSCEYMKDTDLWHVRFDNADNHNVKFFKRDDGLFDVEYSSTSGASRKIPQQNLN